MDIGRNVDILYRMSHVERFTGTFHHQRYSIAEHCYRTAVLFRWFASIENVAYTMQEFNMVLMHDVVEAVTGDLLYPVKHHSEETNRAWALIEKEVTEGTDLKKYTDEEIKNSMTELQFNLFKCCDYLELLIYCYRENECGNISEQINATRDKCISLIREYGRDFKHLLEFIEKFEYGI